MNYLNPIYACQIIFYLFFFTYYLFHSDTCTLCSLQTSVRLLTSMFRPINFQDGCTEFQLFLHVQTNLNLIYILSWILEICLHGETRLLILRLPALVQVNRRLRVMKGGTDIFLIFMRSKIPSVRRCWKDKQGSGWEPFGSSTTNQGGS